jgi:rhodanese-related sulfurtransferase
MYYRSTLLLITVVLQILFFSGSSYSDHHSKSDNANYRNGDDKKISVTAANTLSNQGEMLLIDIRAESEWKQTGIAPQAITLSMHQPGGVPAFESALTLLLNGNKDQPIALICAGGVRSAKLQHYLTLRGFTQVLDVVEGMQGGILTDGWIDHQLPVKAYVKQ